MKQTLKTICFFLIWGGLLVGLPSQTFASTPGSWSNANAPNNPATFVDLEVIFQKLLTVLFSLAGIGLLVTLFIGGFQYLTAGANPKNMEKASATLTFGLIGLLIIISAWIILYLIETITGIKVTVFKVFS
ncbi:hypothetical protein ACFLZP_00225 [Patescibacteria group bacterium]